MTRLDEIKDLEKQGYKIDGAHWEKDASLIVRLHQTTGEKIGREETVHVPYNAPEFREVWKYVMAIACQS